MRAAAAILLLLASTPLAARDSLGVYGEWGAFRDPETPRCYAIARPELEREGEWDAFASVGHWPQRDVRGQVHFRLRYPVGENSRPRLAIGGERFELIGNGPDAWAETRADDRAIVAAMRQGGRMRISARSAQRGGFSDSYVLDGAASAIDAAALGCAPQ